MKRLPAIFLILIPMLLFACSPAVPGPLKTYLKEKKDVKVWNISYWKNLTRVLTRTGYLAPDGSFTAKLEPNVRRIGPMNWVNSGTYVRIATYQIDKIYDVQKTQLKDNRGNAYDKYRLKVRIKVDTLLPELPGLNATDQIIEVLYDSFASKILQSNIEDQESNIIQSYDSAAK